MSSLLIKADEPSTLGSAGRYRPAVVPVSAGWYVDPRWCAYIDY